MQKDVGCPEQLPRLFGGPQILKALSAGRRYAVPAIRRRDANQRA